LDNDNLGNQVMGDNMPPDNIGNVEGGEGTHQQKEFRNDRGPRPDRPNRRGGRNRNRFRGRDREGRPNQERGPDSPPPHRNENRSFDGPPSIAALTDGIDERVASAARAQAEQILRDRQRDEARVERQEQAPRESAPDPNVAVVEGSPSNPKRGWWRKSN
jgi:hypothetical protein